MGLLNKERKGFRCRNNQSDGSVTCERVVKDPKTGEILGDGQTVTVSADPSNNCQPSLSGDSTILDEDFGKFDEVADRVSRGCKKTTQQNKGGE